MQRKIYYIAALFAATATALFTSCEPRAITEDDVFIKSTNVDSIIRLRDAEYHLYTLNEFVDTYMTEQGNFWSDTSQYRTRATNGDGIYLFSLDTLPIHGAGIYIRGRVTTDDYGGNFYKSLVIQQVIDGKQQNLRVSVDLGSVGGMYQLGQEILVRCNGLCIGRYGDQPQLCVPAYNNNIYAQNATQKVGWAPGRIPNAFFRNAVTMLGVPDQSKLQYDTITIADFINLNDEKQMRTMDGRLVVLKNVWFTGKYENQGTLTDCTTGDPETDSYIGRLEEAENGVYSLSKLKFGGYFLYENKAPDGYKKDGRYFYFQIKKDGETVTVENEKGAGFVNEPIPVAEVPSSPKTGDFSNPLVFIIIGLSALFVSSASLIFLRKKSGKE